MTFLKSYKNNSYMGVVVPILYESYVEFQMCPLADCHLGILMVIILHSLTVTLLRVILSLNSRGIIHHLGKRGGFLRQNGLATFMA